MTAPEETEAALLRRLQSGDPAAPAALYDRFAVGLHRYAVTRLAGDTQTAEDVMIEALVEAVRDIHRYSPHKASFSAWVYGIARRRVLLELRRRARRKSIPQHAHVSLESAATEAAITDIAAQTVARLEAQRKVILISQVLTEREMEVLILASIHELSVREIGQIVSRSEQAVHSLLHRARQKARERLAQDE